MARWPFILLGHLFSYTTSWDSTAVTEQTFYRWRNEYGGLRLDQAKRLKHLEGENTRLRRAVADLTVDNQILKEAAEGNF